MVIGIPLAYFTALHVALSLIGLVSGVAALLIGPLGSRAARLTTAVFLSTTLATSLTGLMFPFTRLGPGHVTGVLSLTALAPALVALYGHHLEGPWQRVYTVGAWMALYLNLFIAILQAFDKIAFLHALAPSFGEVTELLVLALFLGLWLLATRPSSVRRRTFEPGQPRLTRARFLRATNRRSFS